MAGWREAPITQGFGPTDEPLDGPYNGYAHFNKGLDFGIPVGTPIDATVEGTVISAGDSGDGWGISVKIRDANGNTHNYGHLSSVNVKPGEAVRAGQVVGASGNTGHSTGPHLSYDVWTADGTYIDPAQFVGVGGGGGSGQVAASGSGSGSAAVAGSQAPDTSSWDGRASLMEQVLDYITSNPPKRSDYPSAEEFSAALAVWQESVGTAASMVQNFQQAGLGLFQAPDGTLIPYTQMSPDQKAFVDTVNENLWRKAENDFQLSNYNLQKDRVQTDLGNITNRFNSLLALDQANISQANAAINRMLGGLGESRARSDYVTSTQLAAAPFASPSGKTSFNAGDLGGAIGQRWASLMGIDPGASILNYTGTMNIDPVGMMSQFDDQLGVTGQLPQIPSLLTGLGDVPGTPALPAAPSLLAPIQMPGAALASGGGSGGVFDLFGSPPYNGNFSLNPNWSFDPTTGQITVPNLPSPIQVDPSLIDPNARSTPHTTGGGDGSGWGWLDPRSWF